MSDTNYSPLEKLSEELNRKIQSLKSGKMTPNEVSGLVQSARQVYERLVVLEFQAHQPEKEAENEEAPVQIEIPAIKINTDPVVEKEASAIEEVSEPEVKVTEEPESTPEEVKEEKVAAPSVKAKEESGSVAEKFENAPLADLSKGYSLNEKFQFIRVLFENNAKAFQETVDTLNSSSDESAALSSFSSIVSEPEGEEDKEVYEKFKELITRRFQA